MTSIWRATPLWTHTCCGETFQRIVHTPTHNSRVQALACCLQRRWCPVLLLTPILPMLVAFDMFHTNACRSPLSIKTWISAVLVEKRYYAADVPIPPRPGSAEAGDPHGSSSRRSSLPSPRATSAASGPLPAAAMAPQV
jgi:hypothetical protein